MIQFVTCYPLVRGHQQPLKGSFDHPQKVTKNGQTGRFSFQRLHVLLAKNMQQAPLGAWKTWGALMMSYHFDWFSSTILIGLQRLIFRHTNFFVGSLSLSLYAESWRIFVLLDLYTVLIFQCFWSLYLCCFFKVCLSNSQTGVRFLLEGGPLLVINEVKTPTWRIIPVSKWLITMVSKSPKWGYSPYKWPKWLVNGGY